MVRRRRPTFTRSTIFPLGPGWRSNRLLLGYFQSHNVSNDTCFRFSGYLHPSTPWVDRLGVLVPRRETPSCSENRPDPTQFSDPLTSTPPLLTQSGVRPSRRYICPHTEEFHWVVGTRVFTTHLYYGCHYWSSRTVFSGTCDFRPVSEPLASVLYVVTHGC